MCRYIPKVSVIVPVHNAARHLRQCIDSIINQSLKDIEIICVDDGSTDDSLVILSEYAFDDSRVRVLRQDKRGAAAARNLGLEAARGDYLIFLDSDDFFSPSLLQDTYRLAQKKTVDIVIFGGKVFDESSDKIGRELSFIDKHFLPSEKVFSASTIPDTIFQTTNPAAWNKLLKLSFVQENHLRFQELPNSNDVFFTYAALAIASAITYVAHPYVFYRSNTASSTQDKRYLAPCCFLDALLALKRFLEAQDLLNSLERSYDKLAFDLIYANIEYAHNEAARLEILKYLAHCETLFHRIFKPQGDPPSPEKRLYLSSALRIFEQLSSESADIVSASEGNDSEPSSFLDSYAFFIKALKAEEELARNGQTYSVDEIADKERISSGFIASAISTYLALSSYERWGEHGLIEHRISFAKRVIEPALQQESMRKIENSQAYRLGERLARPFRILRKIRARLTRAIHAPIKLL